MKTIVIYHSADYDGIFCREIARKFIKDATLVGWNYGDEPPTIPDDIDSLYMLDISIEPLMNHPKLIWIDHHKSAIEKYPNSIKGYRIDGVAACRLAWQWFVINSVPQDSEMPSIQKYVESEVDEPLAVMLAGLYDIWDKRDPRAELFQHGLRSRELNDITWKYLLGEDRVAGEHCVSDLLESGRVIQYSTEMQNESIIKTIGFDLDWEGLHFLACNHARYNSHLFTAGLKSKHDACFGFKWTGKIWEISLYHAPGKEHHDLSKIAVKYGGGGHKGACGMRMEKLPFIK